MNYLWFFRLPKTPDSSANLVYSTLLINEFKFFSPPPLLPP